MVKKKQTLYKPLRHWQSLLESGLPSCQLCYTTLWVSRVTSCFRCVYSFLINKTYPPTLTFNLHAYLPHISIQTPPSSSSPPFEDKTARQWCLDRSRQVQRPAPNIPERKIGWQGWRPGGEGVRMEWREGQKGRVGLIRRIGLVEEIQEAGTLNRSQVQGKQFILAPALLLLLLFGPFIHPPSSNSQSRKPSLSSLVNRWWG